MLSHWNNFWDFHAYNATLSSDDWPQENATGDQGELVQVQGTDYENQFYWWVAKVVMTQALGTEYVYPSLSMNQS